MQLPFTIVFEPPGRAEFRALARPRRPWAVAAVLIAAVVIALTVLRGRVADETDSGRATLQVSSLPDGASIEIDGRLRGQAPASLAIAPGSHHVVLRHDGYADSTYQLNLEVGETATLRGELWLGTPEVHQLRPPFPGAAITAASFLAGGQVALVVAVPQGDERQLWLLDRAHGPRRVGPPEAHGALAAAPDGEHVAYLARGEPSRATATHIDEIWLSGQHGEDARRLYTLPDDAAGERLVDLSWAPDGQQLLVASRRQAPGGGVRTRLLLLDITGGQARDLTTLPSEIVPGSYTWSPSGDRVALLTRTAQLTSLCFVGTSESEFRYLTDLGRDDASPLPFPPLAWSPDGERLLYAAPGRVQSSQLGWLFGPKPGMALYSSEVAQPLTQRVGDAEGQSPAWRDDGSIVALGRSRGSGSLVLRVIDPSGEGQDAGELPFKASSIYAARWDVSHAQALVAVRGSTSFGANRVEYWLVHFRPGVPQ